MKKILSLFFVLSLFAACSDPFDDSEIRKDITDLQERVAALEKICKEMNNNITAMQTIVNALQNNDYVTGVTPVTENGKVIGYTITFTKSQPITIYHGGTDGKNSHTHIIGVKEDTDGVYYWTLDGEWLTDDDGNKIKAVGTDGKDGITPQLKIEEGYWYISYDNGASWKMLGKATGEKGEKGDSFFNSVSQDEQHVYFTLSDGTTLKVPKDAMLEVTFSNNNLLVMHPNSTREMAYTVECAADNVTVEVTSSADIKAKVVYDTQTGKKGRIVINTSATIDEYSKVIVFVSDGKRVIMKSITFEQSGIKINDTMQRVAATGGIVDIYFLSNMECKVVIPSSASNWLSVAPATRAMSAHTARIQVEANHTLHTRSAVVKIMTTDGNLSADFQIAQDTFNEFTATTPLTGGWASNDAITVFAGNDKNREFRYKGTTGAASGTFMYTEIAAAGTTSAINAHYAIYPYDSNASITAAGAVSTTLAAEQKHVAGGMDRKNNVMIAATNGINDCQLNFQPLTATVCIKLWGAGQTIKSISLTANGGEALAGTATIKATGAGISSCTVNGSSTIKLNGVNDITVGTTQATATEFRFAVPAVTLSQGYTVNVEGFYGGKQSITAGATSLVAGKTYTTVTELAISTDGMGSGVGSWGDGGENGGTAD